MKTELTMDFYIDKENKQVKVRREFAAPLMKVWQAWTQSETLDQWWAPKPWKAQTKKMDFTEGGRWLYAMKGPDGETHWSYADFQKIVPRESFTALEAFSDENGKTKTDMPQSTWKVSFSESGNSTFVNIAIAYETQSDLEKELNMGFREGFTKGLENLDELLEK